MSQADNALGNPAHGRLPHIVFTYTLGERLKLSCTVYFADAFDSLRRRCAIEKAMIDSLSQVENWDASGGKSKAAFFMTKDKRFIVKELVAGWIGSDT
jgi:1-phosphatidylinositol-3-phosphate 5-kinase